MMISKFGELISKEYNRTIQDCINNYMVIYQINNYLIEDSNYAYLYAELYKRFKFDTKEAYNSVILYNWLTIFEDNSFLYYKKDLNMLKSYFDTTFKSNLERYTQINKDVYSLDLNDYIEIKNQKSKFI